MLQLKYPVLLASKSPRRHDLLNQIGVKFDILSIDTDESFPSKLNGDEVAEYIAIKKANAVKLRANYLLITADTVVVAENEILGKPKDNFEAEVMLNKLSGKEHQVYTGVCIRINDTILSFTDKTNVFCKYISNAEIDFYIKNYHPFDKAGSYGIQDWFGLTQISRIEGSYTNVMGLPTERVYHTLKEINKK